MYVGMSVCMYLCMYIYVYKAGFKKRIVIYQFLLSLSNYDSLWQSDLQLRIIIRNLFAFLQLTHKFVIKKENFV